MVTEAIKSLKERNGSSVQAIKKYMTTAYPDVATKFAPHQLRSALKKGTEAGKFIKVSTIHRDLCSLFQAESLSITFRPELVLLPPV